MGNETVVSKNKNIVSRAIGDEVVLVPVYKTSKEINCIYSLNKVAARVWDLLDGKRSVFEVKKQLTKEFDGTEIEIDKVLHNFLKDLKEANVIS